MDINPIYKFMKDNGLTQKDEATFLSEYSDPNKAAQLHKFMVDNQLTTKGSDDFYNEYFSPSKKKVPTGSSVPSGQPGQPSAPSFGQKITEKIAGAATQIPLKTSLQQQKADEQLGGQIVTEFSQGLKRKQEEKKQAYEQGGYAYEKLKEKEAQESQLIAQAKEETRKNDQAKTFVPAVRDRDISKEPGRDESIGYTSDVTSSYVDYLANTDPNRGLFIREKYNKLKSLDSSDRNAEDEKFLRQTESEALDITYRAKMQELDLIVANIENLQKIAVTPSDVSRLNYLYKKYETTKNSLNGISSAYDQNKNQYGDIIGKEMQSQDVKSERFKELQQDEYGVAKTIEFFKGIGNAFTNGLISLGQLPKVMGDLVGDKDYDWSDEIYDSISNTKSNVDIFFGTPLPGGKSMSELPTSARIAVVGGNAIGSVGLFAVGGGLVGATTNLGKAAATFGTSFLTTEADYYQEALDAGMNPQDAAVAGSYLAAQTALVESIIPDVKYFEPSAFRKSVMQGLTSGVRAGLPIKEAAKLAFKNTVKAIPESGMSILKTGTKEAGEEALGQVGEDVAKEIVNASSQREYFNDTFNGEAYTDAILGGFIAGGGLSVFSRPTPKSPVQQEAMREIVDRRDMLTERGTAADKIGNKEDLKDFNEATEVFDAMSSHSAWKGMSREKQNKAFALAQQASLMKKEQERMKKLRIPDEQKDAEIKQLEDEVNAMFAEQLEQQKQAIYDQENIQGLPGQVGVGQEPIQAGVIQGAGTEAPQAGGVLQTQREEIERRRQEELESNANSIRVKVETYNTLNISGEPVQVEITTNKDGSRVLKAREINEDGSIDPLAFITERINNKTQLSLTNEQLIEGFIGNENNTLKKISEDLNPPDAKSNKINAKYNAELAALEAPQTQVAPTRISEINNLEQALFENEVQQNETGTGTMSEQQIADVTAKLDEMRSQNKEGGLNEVETLMKQALGENLITAADIDKMVDEGSVEIKCPPGTKKAEHGMRMGFIPGGKWDIVTEFKGNSHEKGGIDVEILGGKISYTGKEPNLKAKKGGFWKAVKDVGLTIADTALGTVGNVAGIKSMQDIIDEDQYSNDRFDEAGNFAGKLAGTALKVIPVTAPIASAAGMVGGAINQAAGIDARYYDPSQHTSKLDQAGNIISAVGSVVGMAVGAGTAAAGSKALAAGDKLTAAQKVATQFGGINKALGTATKGMNMLGVGATQQQPQQMFSPQYQPQPNTMPQQTFQNPYQQQQYGAPVQQTYSNNRSQVVTINGVNYAPDQYGNLIPLI
jgi:hypothetical protein